jgi:hypothetical protein
LLNKELLNALAAIDEMIAANEINMNLAAISPVMLLGYSVLWLGKFVFYTFLRLGTSREETYSSFGRILTDMERLLVMRDNPPCAAIERNDQANMTAYYQPKVLNSDDKGMIMLLIHECRSILRDNHRRFPSSMIRSISEDLSELAGERGPVSVQQQLRMLSRMARTYPFLNRADAGLFSYSRLLVSDS